MGDVFNPRRPWCFCCGSHASYLGVACSWHWELLSDAARTAIEAEVLAAHPRGGRVRRVTEQAWVTRASAGPARREWQRLRAFEAAEDRGEEPGEWEPYRDAPA